MYTFTGVWRRGIEQKKLASLEFGEETWDWTKKNGSGARNSEKLKNSDALI